MKKPMFCIDCKTEIQPTSNHKLFMIILYGLNSDKDYRCGKCYRVINEAKYMKSIDRTT